MLDNIVDILQSHYLLYADDSKIFRRIDSELNNWYLNNRLFLNVTKCLSVSYGRKICPVVYNNKINDGVLHRCSEFNDLGVKFNNKLSFIPNINTVTASAA